jgi:hypothetical protein
MPRGVGVAIVGLGEGPAAQAEMWEQSRNLIESTKEQARNGVSQCWLIAWMDMARE